MSCFRSRLYNRLEELFRVERYGGKRWLQDLKACFIVVVILRIIIIIIFIVIVAVVYVDAIVVVVAAAAAVVAPPSLSQSSLKLFIFVVEINMTYLIHWY